MEGAPQISDNSRRIARNTLALYSRMLILMVIGLFTARIVLGALGIEDRGVYDTVGSFVSMMAIVTSSLSTAISRFLTVEIGKGDTASLKKVFATANAIMLIVAAVVILIAEPVGLWYIDNVMNLPDGRLSAARWVFQFSLATFVINMLSVPYNATIIAHEKMSAFAVIGVVEGVCKLLVALALLKVSMDKLILYALLMCCVALLVRFLYASYCRRCFEESRTGVRFDKEYSRQMFGGIAFNVENMVKQFVTNVLQAINPQITKSFVSGDTDYSFNLVCKGAKYSFLIIFILAVPFLFEAEMLLALWLKAEFVPEGTALFTRLTLLCLLLDLLMTSSSTLVQASGRIRKFYIVTSCITFLIFPLTWIAYRLGAPAYVCYLVFIGVYVINDIVKLFLMREIVGFPISLFMKEVILKVLPVVVITLLLTFLVCKLVPAGGWRLLAVLFTGTVSTCITTYTFALTEGERAFVRSKLRFLSR